ncbi:amidohydrolase [Kordiimonas sp. SCSIO 12603]|nr:amidohydrolase [Kordiimonas sp. SCSIO 12603]
MRYLKSLFLAMVLVAPAWAQDDFLQEDAAPSAAEERQVADTIIWGGMIYTADDAKPQVEAVAIKNGRFIAVGSRAEVELLQGVETRIIDLDGNTLFPGFVDAHAHLSGIGNRELSLNLDTVKSLAAFKGAVLAWRASHPDDVVVTGRGWIETHWPEKRFPSRWDIDDVVSDVPVILRRADGHALVANSKAFELAGITSETDAPFGGEIVRNKLGENTGMLVDAAQSLLNDLVPETTDEDIAERLVKGSEVYASRGWTGMHNMSVSWGEVDQLEELSDSDGVKIRVYNSVVPEAAADLFASGARASDDGTIITRAIKLYMDGALGSRGAALIEPYSDADTSGLVLITKEDTMPMLVEALNEGIQVNMHAIGDRANRMLLDWFEEAMNTVPAIARPVENPRWRDEHTQIVNQEDILRYQQLGVIPSMQPSHAIGDLHFAPARLGDERLDGAYAWSSLIDSGVIIAGGSDAPVEKGDPLIEFYAATARKDLNGFQAENWHEEEALTRAEALKMFTLWPAIASFQENDLGSIVVGKKADLTAFDTDLMTTVESDIPKARAMMTMVDGNIIYLRSE